VAVAPAGKTFVGLCLSNLVVGCALLAGVQWSSPGSVDHYLAGVTDDTGYHVSLGKSHASSRLDALGKMISERLDSLDQQLSPLRPDSDVSRLSHAPLLSSVAIPSALSHVLCQLMKAQRLSQGAFTPYLRPETAPLLPSWTLQTSGSAKMVLSSQAVPTNVDLPRQSVRHMSALPPAHALLYLGNHAIPLAPFRLNLVAAVNGLRADTLVHLLESQGISHFWLEIGGIIMVGNQSRTFTLGNGDRLTLQNQALLHGENVSGDHFWIVSMSGEAGALQQEVLSRLATSAGRKLALARGWQVRWANGSQ